MGLQDKKQIFEGVVTGVTDFGVFVEITETSCEGMVRLADLKDDYYELDKANYRVIGRRGGRVINFGDLVKVRVIGTDLERRSMDFELMELSQKKLPQARSKNTKRKTKIKGDKKTKRKSK